MKQPQQDRRPRPSRKRRIALYSPGMVGIGHMRRSLLVAQALAASPVEANILMIAEAREANVLALPPGGDCLTLPALRKEHDGFCKPRYLNVPLVDLLTLRSQAIRVAMESFQPDVLIVDHLPRGALRELDGTLEELRAGGRTRCVLGLRDVLDHPEQVCQEWSAARNEEAIRDYYDAVWIYGDPAVYDTVHEYHFGPAVAAKVEYTGYLDCRWRCARGDPDQGEIEAVLPRPNERLVLCTVGGGQDGAQLAEAFAQAELPADSVGVILMGPFMPVEAQQRLRARAAVNPRLRVLGFVANPDLLLQRAERVVAMGGYNTIFEILSFEKHALIVPRSKPRHEQQIRAECLRRRRLLDVLAPEEVSAVALADWLARDLGPPPPVRAQIDMNGFARLPDLLRKLLAAPPCPNWQPAAEEELENVTT